jgi:hypothetical protein
MGPQKGWLYFTYLLTNLACKSLQCGTCLVSSRLAVAGAPKIYFRTVPTGVLSGRADSLRP